MNKSWIVGKQILKGCLRAKSLSLVGFFLVTLVVFMSMLSSSDSAYRHALVIDSGLSLINVFGLFLVGLIILPIFQSEKERHTLSASLAFDISRSQFLWGLWLGAGVALFINYAGMAIIFMINLLVLKISPEIGVFRQLFLNFVELLTLGTFAIAFSVFFSYVVATMLTVVFFVVGSMTIAFHQAVSAWQGSIVGKLLNAIWLVIPDFSLFNLKDIILKGTPIPYTYELIAVLYAFAMIFIVMELAKYRLNNESLM